MRTIYVSKIIPKMLAVKTLRGFWPSVIWSPLSPVTVEDVPEPPLPGSRGVRVRNRVCGICATDLSLLEVKVDPSVGPAALPGNTRFYLGHEVVSDVVEVGPEVETLRPGQRVAMDHRLTGASCATLGIDPPCRFCAAGDENLCENLGGAVGIGGGWSDGYTASEHDLYPVPEDLGDDQAAMIEPMSIAVHGVLRRPPAAGEHVLVIGAGAIGLFTIQAARAFGPQAHITAIARYPHQAEAARRCGADEVLSGGDLYDRLAAISGAKVYRAPLNRGMLMGGFEVVYDCVGSSQSITDSLRWARARGTVVMIGIEVGFLRSDLNPVWYQEVDLIGSRTHGQSSFAGKRRHDYAWVIDLQRDGKMWIEGLITHRFPLAEHKRAIRAWSDKRTSGAIKVVFDIPG